MVVRDGKRKADVPTPMRARERIVKGKGSEFDILRCRVEEVLLSRIFERELADGLFWMYVSDLVRLRL